MIRGRTLRRIAGVLACACVAGAGGAPTTVGAQSAVDEYTLDIPGGGASGSSDPGAPPSSPSGAAPSSGAAAAEGSSSASGGVSEGSASAPGGGRSGSSGDVSGAKRDADTEAVGDFSKLHSGPSGFGAAVKPDPRSAPEVVADALLDDAMLPLLGALVLITGVGAWRVLRHHRTLTRAAG